MNLLKIFVLLTFGLQIFAAEVNEKNFAEFTDSNTQLINFCKTGDVVNVEALLNARADVNARDLEGLTPICTAVRFGKANIVELLVKAKANVNIANNDNNVPLHYAASHLNHKERVAIFQLLVDAKADVNASNNCNETALDWASQYNRFDLLKKLIENKGIINGGKHQVALHNAVTNNN